MSVYIWGSTPIQEESTIPKQIIINFTITKLSCGEEHLLLLSNQNQLYTVGCNNFGALGIGSEDFQYKTTTPTLIASNVIDIDSGWNHGAYLNANSSAFVWGRAFSNAPKQIGADIKTIACGARHSMLITSSNELYAIGANDSGQCGIQNSKKLMEPTFVMDNVTQIALGVSHSLIKSDQLFSCGSNTLHQLGIPGIKNTNKPMPIDLPSSVSHIAAGNHSAAVVQGNLFLWGCGSFGTYQKPTLFLTDISLIKVNGTLGLAVDNKQQLYSWGSNVNGELGVGDTNSRSEAIKVNLKNVELFDAGIGYGVAIVKNSVPVSSEKEYLAKTLQIESEERSALERINRDLKMKLLEQESIIIDQKKQLESKNEDIRQLNGRLNNLNNDYASSESQHKDYRSQCHRYQQFQKEAIAKIQKYEEMMKELQNDNCIKNQQINDLENQLENFQNCLKTYQDDESQQLNEIKNQVTELTDQLADEQSINEQLKEELINDRQAIEQKNILIQQYEFEIGNQLNNNKQLAQSLQTHLSQHQKLQEALSMANHRIESLQTQNAKLMQELSIIRTSLYSDTQKPQVMEIQTVLTLNKELTELNNRLQTKLREKDQQIMRLKTNTNTLQSCNSSQTMKESIQQDTPSNKTIQELLESAHKHAKYMKKILKESEGSTPTKRLEFTKENHTSDYRNQGKSSRYLEQKLR